MGPTQSSIDLDWQQTADAAAAVLEIDVWAQDSVNRKSYSLNLHPWKPGAARQLRAQARRRVATPDLSAEFHVEGAS